MAGSRPENARRAARRRFRAAVALALCWASAGCSSIPTKTVTVGSGMSEAERRNLSVKAEELFSQQPRNAAHALESFTFYLKVAQGGSRDYETLWHAARSGTWVAQRTAEDQRKIQLALQSIELCNTAMEVDPKRPEAYYYHAVATGLLAQADHDYGLKGMKVMIADCTKLVEIDPAWNAAGGHRLLGNVYHKAPGPPIGPGSDRKARVELTKACELAPAYGGNWLYLLELDVDEENAELGRAHLGKFFDTAPPPGLKTEYDEWRADAAKFTKQLEAIEKNG